jgi:hypothetical protein
LEANKDLPELARAVSLALGVLRHAKVHAWSELGSMMPVGLELTQGQYDLMIAHAQYLGFIRFGTPVGKEKSPTVTVAVCPKCDGWILMSSGAAPSKCKITLGCTGTPMKAGVAKKIEVKRQQSQPLSA